MDTEDGRVDCIKPRGAATDAAAAISARTATFIAGNKDDLDESNPFASDEDLEDNETVIDDK